MEAKLTSHHIALVHQVELHRSGWRERADSELILGTFWLVDEDMTVDDVQRQLRDHLKISRSADIITRSLFQLIQSGQLIKVGEDLHRLSLAAREDLNKRVADAERLESTARTRFSSLMEQHCPTLGADYAWGQFYEHLLVPVIWKTGAQTYELLARKSLSDHVEGSLDGFVGRFAEDARSGLIIVIQHFLNPDDDELRGYILAILNTSFLMRAADGGGDEIAALSSTTSHKPAFEIYVDTNYLFCILGLHDNPSNEDAQALLNLVSAISKTTKIRLRVSTVTLHELRAALTNIELRLSGLRLHMNMAQAVLELGTPGLVGRLAAATKAANRQISAEELFRPYRDNPVQALRGHGIVPLEPPRGSLKTRQDVIDDIESRRAHLIRQGKPRSYAQIEHDMVLWHEVKDMRSSFVESPVDAKYWIVTVDYSFLGFDSFKLRTDGGSVPICIHPATLMHMLQLWVPRSGEMDRAIVGSLRSLFLFSRFDPAAEAVTVRILETIALYENSEDLSVATIESMLVNDSLRSRMSLNKTDAERIALVREAMVEELASVNALLKEQSESAKSTDAAHIANEQALTEKIATLESALGSVSSEHQHTKAELEEHKRTIRTQRARQRFTMQWLAAPFTLVVILSVVAHVTLSGKFSPMLIWGAAILLAEAYLWWIYPNLAVAPEITSSTIHTAVRRIRLLFFPAILVILFLWSVAGNAAWTWASAQFPSIAPPP